MPEIESIKKELEDIETLRSISSALLEISSTRIKSLRLNFDKNQSFYKEISDLYNIVKLSAIKQQYTVAKKQVNTSKIFIAITANQRFYGSLNRIVMEAFIDDLKKEKNINCLIVGNTGKRYIEERKHVINCEFMSFKNNYPTPREIAVFLDKVKEYGQVILYYPKFVNIFLQEVQTTDITYTPTETEENKDVSNIENIFEPELPLILEFFETQIKKLLFTRIMFESELSRTAARLIKMNSTESKATEAIKANKALLKKEITITNDIRLLETFSSIVQWKKN